MMSRVVIIGANGQLGTDCVEAFENSGYDVESMVHSRLDVADAAAVEAVIGEIAPTVVVNTAAMHNVEGCEADPEQAFRINGLGSRNLVIASRRQSFRLIHISTDYVFDGAKRAPYIETDLPAPVNTYGVTKLAGEHFIQAEAEDAVVVRTSGLYGRSPCRAKQGGLNFVQRMLQLASERGFVQVVTDEYVTPTHTLDLARQIVSLADSDIQGVVHATCQGECTWFEFAEAIFELSDVPVRLERTTSAAFPSKVRRPSYSVLDNLRLREAGIDGMPHWREALATYLREIGSPPEVVPAHQANR
jgi:dTDP-4-dehydrorhamnose reductase